ncbi:hypothetical protein BJP27_09235 [Pseudomonas oryzihabitans]|nr:hypothetical protein BJP27_09235 [Pseudomonas psychrotolerans]
MLTSLLFVVIVAKACGYLMRRVGQPQVVGEMIAGFLVGPVVLGQFIPSLQAFLFDPASTAQLKTLSDFGLLLFMFVIGAEFRFPSDETSGSAKAMVVGLCSIILPFLLGAAVAPWLYVRFSIPDVSPLAFCLFIGTVFSVTAFPVLARILKEQSMLASREGAVSMLAAAMSDVGVWFLLAIVAIVYGNDGDLLMLAARISGLLLLIGFSLLVLRPMLARWLAKKSVFGQPQVLLTLLAGVMIYGSFTYWLQVHAVFGAFLFGLCLPRDEQLLQMIVERLEHLVLIALMPCFFALAGLSTVPGVFAQTGLGALIFVLLVAVIGKLFGGAAGARLVRYPWRTALIIGVLMNTRGLMELVVLKIGLDMGLISAQLFTLLVIMTIITTLMTGPLLKLANRSHHKLLMPQQI